jgi:ELWxxDGT repeat protein
LWKTDGTAGGTSRIADLYVEVDLFKKQQMAALGDRLFFSAQTPAAATGYELFMSDGTAAGTRLVKDIQAGTAGSSPRNMTVVGQELYFLAGSNYSLYRTDASGAEPELVASGVPDNLNTMAVVGDYLYYETGSPIAGDDLWRVKAGSPAEHVASMDIIEGVYNIHNRLIVQTRTVETSVSSLYESDGTPAGTRQIAYLGFPHIAIAPLHETPFGAVFSAGPITYATDLTTEGTRRIMNNKSLSGVRVYHGVTYLQIATAGNLGVTDGLYVTDGTEAGTKQLRSGYFYLENNETIDGRMYFEGFGYESNRFGLWESDGTADGTREVTAIVPGPIEGNPQPMVDLNRTLLMVADDHGDHGQEVWRVNPDVVAPVVQDVAFRPGDGARPAVKVRFSERVAASLTAGSIELTGANGQAVATGPVTIDYDSASDTATFTFSAGLADGNYHLRVPPEMTSDPSGNVLAEARALDFYMLGGDANGDCKVDFNDLVSLAQNYNTVGGKTWVDGDFTGDGNVDFNDLVVLAQRYNTSLAEPGAVPAPAAATTSFASDWAALTNVAAPVTTPIEKKEKRKPLFSVKPVAKPAPAKKRAARAGSKPAPTP